MRISLSFILFFVICLQIHGQSLNFKELIVGDQMIEVELSSARNLPKHIKKTSDLKGQLILLDFWSLGCVSCIRAFPKLLTLQKEFEGKFQVIVINPDKPDSLVDNYINSLKNDEIKKSYQSLSSVNGGSFWLDLFPYKTVPHHVWISPEGKVVAITNGSNANFENVKGALEGNKLNLLPKEDLIGYDVSKNGLLKQGHEKLPFPNYYSVFMPFHSGIGSGTYIDEDSIANTFRCTQRNLSIPTLYRLASLQNRILVETNKVSRANEFINTDSWKLKNLLTYELLLPLSQKLNYRSLMLQDLNRYLAMEKNIEGVVEDRELPAYIIVHKKHIENSDTKFNSKQNEEPVQIDNIETLHAFAQMLFEDLDERRIVVDETGLPKYFSLEFSLPETINDIKTLREHLQLFGFDVVEGRRTVEVLVIREKNGKSPV